MDWNVVLTLLRCPVCANSSRIDAGRLSLVEGHSGGQNQDRQLVCRDCRRQYPIRGQIPVMRVEQARLYQNVNGDGADLE